MLALLRHWSSAKQYIGVLFHYFRLVLFLVGVLSKNVDDGFGTGNGTAHGVDCYHDGFGFVEGCSFQAGEDFVCPEII